jgi:hypothetical protein
MILAMVAMLAVMAVIAVGSMLLRDTQDIISNEAHAGQAVSLSMAGLTEALSWFRRQTAQPVTSFSPQRDLAANPPINDTDDANIGIVREFEISQSFGLWGRYEVRTYALDASGGTVLVVRDVSVDRNLTSMDNGWAWYVESKGIIFKKADATAYQTTSFYNPPISSPSSYAYTPNRTAMWTSVGWRPYVTIVTSATSSTEIRRLVFQPPAGGGALCSRRGDNVTIAAKARVAGGSKPGLLYPTGTGNSSQSGELTGTPARLVVSPAADYQDGVASVFGGMTKTDLRTTADLYATAMSSLPSRLPEYSLVYYKGNPTFTASQPLRGTGILFVEGNLTIDYDSNSFYSGIIYVEGTYTQRSPSLVKGMVIVTSTCRLEGVGDYAELDYDPELLNQVLMFMGQYRFSKPITFVRTAD